MASANTEVQDRPDAAILRDVRGLVRFEGVTYRFPGSEQGVFDLDFAAAPGETVALVGPTGAGKTVVGEFDGLIKYSRAQALRTDR